MSMQPRTSPLLAQLWGWVVMLPTDQDMTTEEGRALERERRIILTGIASVAAKAITIATGLVSVPLTLHYLGPERYGMWMTMSTLIAMLSFADFGIGNGLLSSVAAAFGRDDRETIQALVTSAFAVLTLIAVALIGLLLVVYPMVDWAWLFNVTTPQAVAEAGPTLVALVSCFALAIPFGVVPRIQMALQLGFMANIWQCFTSLVGLIAVLSAIHFEASLPYLVLGFAGAPQLANILNGLLFFGWQGRDVAPRLGAASLRLARSIAGPGLMFLILQIVASIINASDGIVIAQILGASAVADYSVAQKLFGVIGTALAMVLAPLWPAYSEAIARGDRRWVFRTLKRSLIMSVGAAILLSLPLVGFGNAIIAAWVGPTIVPPLSLLIGLGFWKVVEAASVPLAMYLNGAHVVFLQVVVSSVTCIVAMVMKYLLVTEIGISGAPWATIFAYVLFVILPYWFLMDRLLGRERDKTCY